MAAIKEGFLPGQSMNVPDYTAPIVGYRGWFFHPDADRLMSSSMSMWYPGKAMEATCYNHSLRRLFFKTSHPSPKENCTCGIYALKSPLKGASLFGVYSIYGEVYLWGKVVEHEYGWRAQYAYPKTFTLTSEDQPQIFGRWRPFSLLALFDYEVEIRTPDGTVFWTPSLPKPRWVQ
jgi:hypothetical protein